MNEYRRNSKLLIALAVLALAYGGALYFLHTLTGNNKLDGSIGVLLGLYICSQPAANAIDALFFARRGNSQSAWAEVRWLALNALVLILGWLVITLGIIRLVSRI